MKDNLKIYLVYKKIIFKRMMMKYFNPNIKIVRVVIKEIRRIIGIIEVEVLIKVIEHMFFMENPMKRIIRFQFKIFVHGMNQIQLMFLLIIILFIFISYKHYRINNQVFVNFKK